MFSQTYNSFFRKQNVAFPAGGIMIITSPTVSFLSVFFGYHGIIGGTVFFVSVLLITVQTCPFLALLLLVPHIFIFPHFKYNHCYHNYHYCYHHHHHIISTQITSRQWLRQLDQASALRFIRSMDCNGHVNLLSSQIPTAHSSWKRCAADDLSWRPNSQNPRPYQEGGRMEARIFQGIFLHPRRGKGLGSLARTVHAMEGKSDECRDFNTSGSHSKRSAKAACCFLLSQ